MSQLAHPSELDVQARPATAAPPSDAAATLYDLYRQRIREYCVGQLRDRQDADDAVQSTFLYAFTLLQRGVTPTKPLPWLYTIAHNVCRTRRRAIKRRSKLESGVDLDTLHDSVGRNDPPREELANLRTSLGALPAAQRDALLLREWQGLPDSEIAPHLGLTESAVEALLFRARRSLAQKLQRTAERVTSFAGGVLLLRSVRRLAPFASTTKATVAAVAIGAAAVTTLAPSDRPVSKIPGVERQATASIARGHAAGLTRMHAAPAIRKPPRAAGTPVQASSALSAAAPDDDSAPTASVVVTPAPTADEHHAGTTTTPVSVGGNGTDTAVSATPATVATVAGDVTAIVNDAQGAATAVEAAVDHTVSSLPPVPDLGGALGPPGNAAISTVEQLVPPVIGFPPPPSAPLLGKP